jgi:hypothetical protein
VTFARLVADVIGHLTGAGVPYMVTGSAASSYHGVPRATRDLDVVIDPEPETLERLVESLVAAGFYVDRDAAAGALRERSQFNAIGNEGEKVDFIIRRDRPFSIEEFARRQPADILGTPGFIATAEDMIVAKLEWAAASESERQVRDVAGMLDAAAGAVDLPYIERWVAALKLLDPWDSVRPRD